MVLFRKDGVEVAEFYEGDSGDEDDSRPQEKPPATIGSPPIAEEPRLSIFDEDEDVFIPDLFDEEEEDEEIKELSSSSDSLDLSMEEIQAKAYRLGWRRGYSWGVGTAYTGFFILVGCFIGLAVAYVLRLQ